MKDLPSVSVAYIRAIELPQDVALKPVECYVTYSDSSGKHYLAGGDRVGFYSHELDAFVAAKEVVRLPRQIEIPKGKRLYCDSSGNILIARDVDPLNDPLKNTVIASQMLESDW